MPMALGETRDKPAPDPDNPDSYNYIEDGRDMYMQDEWVGSDNGSEWFTSEHSDDVNWDDFKFPIDGNDFQQKKWIREYAVPPEQKKLGCKQFSHSNFKGRSDGMSKTGKFNFPNDEWTDHQFAVMIVSRYMGLGKGDKSQIKAMTLTENALPVHPLIFDLDFLCMRGVPEIFDEYFFMKLADIVLEVLCEEDRKLPFELSSFTAHGHHSEKNQAKFSYHVYFTWPNHGVDKNTISRIRLYVLDRINKLIMDEKDTFWSKMFIEIDNYCDTGIEKVFDKTPCTAPVGCFRLPFCDKAMDEKEIEKKNLPRGALEGRPVIPSLCIPYIYKEGKDRVEVDFDNIEVWDGDVENFDENVKWCKRGRLRKADLTCLQLDKDLTNTPEYDEFHWNNGNIGNTRAKRVEIANDFDARDTKKVYGDGIARITKDELIKDHRFDRSIHSRYVPAIYLKDFIAKLRADARFEEKHSHKTDQWNFRRIDKPGTLTISHWDALEKLIKPSFKQMVFESFIHPDSLKELKESSESVAKDVGNDLAEAKRKYFTMLDKVAVELKWHKEWKPNRVHPYLDSAVFIRWDVCPGYNVDSCLSQDPLDENRKREVGLWRPEWKTKERAYCLGCWGDSLFDNELSLQEVHDRVTHIHNAKTFSPAFDWKFIKLPEGYKNIVPEPTPCPIPHFGKGIMVTSSSDQMWCCDVTGVSKQRDWWLNYLDSKCKAYAFALPPYVIPKPVHESEILDARDRLMDERAVKVSHQILDEYKAKVEFEPQPQENNLGHGLIQCLVCPGHPIFYNQYDHHEHFTSPPHMMHASREKNAWIKKAMLPDANGNVHFRVHSSGDCVECLLCTKKDGSYYSRLYEHATFAHIAGSNHQWHVETILAATMPRDKVDNPDADKKIMYCDHWDYMRMTGEFIGDQDYDPMQGGAHRELNEVQSHLANLMKQKERLELQRSQPIPLEEVRARRQQKEKQKKRRLVEAEAFHKAKRPADPAMIEPEVVHKKQPKLEEILRSDTRNLLRDDSGEIKAGLLGAPPKMEAALPADEIHVAKQFSAAQEEPEQYPPARVQPTEEEKAAAAAKKKAEEDVEMAEPSVAQEVEIEPAPTLQDANGLPDFEAIISAAVQSYDHPPSAEPTVETTEQ